MSEFLAKLLLGNMPLVPIDKLFESPLGLFFDCCGIARAVPITIDKTKVHLDFHIYAILEFDLLIGHPHEKLFKEKPFHGRLDEKLGTTASATPIPCPKNPKAKQQPNHNMFEEAKFISPFVSPKLACETECISSPSLELKSCPSSQLNTIFNSVREPTLILHDRFCAMDMPKAPTLELEMNDSTNEHEHFSFEFPNVSCSLLESLEFVVLGTICFHEDLNYPLNLVSKLFKRMVVDTCLS
jgi:hypothetical protein